MVSNENEQKYEGLQVLCQLDFLFQEVDLFRRYDQAQRCGFQGVETANPYSIPLADIAKAKVKSGLCQVLINTPITDDGKFGHASVPGQRAEFRDGLCRAAVYATELNCRFINIMSGVVEKPECVEDHHQTYVENLKEAVSVLEPMRIYGLIEPKNTYAIPNYFLDTYEKAASVIEEVGSSSIRLLLDVYHMQHIRGNLTKSIAHFLPLVKHVQIAQVPARNEPDSPGEINYNYILTLLDELGYDGWIGLEYHPKRGTEDGLTWCKEKMLRPGNENLC